MFSVYLNHSFCSLFLLFGWYMTRTFRPRSTQSKSTFERLKTNLCSLKAKLPLFTNSSLLQANANLDPKARQASSRSEKKETRTWNDTWNSKENFAKSRRGLRLWQGKSWWHVGYFSVRETRQKVGLDAGQWKQLTEAAQHHLKELFEDERTSKYSVSDDDNATWHAHCIGER